jgi:hypothetical protein
MADVLPRNLSVDASWRIRVSLKGQIKGREISFPLVRVIRRAVVAGGARLPRRDLLWVRRRRERR